MAEPEPKLSVKQMKESIREAGLPTADLADDDPRAAWASPAAVLDALLGEGPLALDEIPAKLPWKVDA